MTKLKAVTVMLAMLTTLAVTALEANAQSRLEILEPGPGRAGELLAELLTLPYVTRLPTVAQLELPSDSSFDRSLIVVGSDLAMAGDVKGDVVVIGGDLFLRPGAHVAGRAVAFGGGVYPTLVSDVEGAIVAFRDLTFDLHLSDDTAVDGLVYRSLVRDYRDLMTLPGFYGVRIPTYDRVNGLSVSLGPELHLIDSKLTLSPLITYRSDLGTVDPSLTAQLALSDDRRLVMRAERGTFSNDGWSRPETLNSALSLLFANDQRNYWRAVRAEAFLRSNRQLLAGPLTLSVGARWEDARSVGPEEGSRSGPWSAAGANDLEGMLRPNPPVLCGELLSALVTGDMSFLLDNMTGQATVSIETPLSSPSDGRWLQTTLDGRVDVPTFGSQQLEVRGHVVATAGDVAPPQRWSYLGGGATIPTLDRLEQGGDMLLYLDASYLVPLPTPQLPLIGAPVVSLRYVVGGAGAGSLPDLVQNVGGGIGFSMIRLTFLVDPATGRTAFGLSVSPFR